MSAVAIDVALAALDLASAAELAAIDEAGAQPAVDQVRDALARLLVLLPEVPPPPLVRARLDTALGLGRFERFAARIAAFYDVGVDRAREILGWIDTARPWLPATPGLSLVHFRGGPAAATADCGLIRVTPGSKFPWHAHVGEERSLFLAGVAQDHAGVRYRPGDELVEAPGSGHDFTAVSDDDLVLAVRYHGVDFTAQPPAR